LNCRVGLLELFATGGSRVAGPTRERESWSDPALAFRLPAAPSGTLVLEAAGIAKSDAGRRIVGNFSTRIQHDAASASSARATAARPR
jgi:hypothetical protein